MNNLSKRWQVRLLTPISTIAFAHYYTERYEWSVFFIGLFSGIVIGFIISLIIPEDM